MHIGDVVEAPADLIFGEPLGRIDRERQHVLDQTSVFGSVQSLGRPATRLGSGVRDSVDFCLQLFDQMIQRIAFRAGHPPGRHHPRTKLLDDLLGELDVLIGTCGVERVEAHPSQQGHVVVTGDAILLDHLVRRRRLPDRRRNDRYYRGDEYRQNETCHLGLRRRRESKFIVSIPRSGLQ